METPETIRISLQQGEWVTSLDFSDAYFHIPIHTGSRKFLRFHFQNQSFQSRALPFGLSTAPMEFTCVVKEVKLMAQGRGIRIHQYLDDWLIRAPTKESCHQGTQSLLGLCQELGWVVNLQKSELEPKQVFEFVGYKYDLSQGLVKPTQNRWESLLQKVQAILARPSCRVRTFMSLIGLLTATEKQVPLGRLQMRPIQWHLKRHWRVPESLEKEIPVPKSLHEHLLWWTKDTNVLQGQPLQSAPLTSCHSGLYRRLKRRLGCSLRRLRNKRCLVGARGPPSHKLPRTKGSLTGLKKVPAPSSRKSSTNCYRQHHSCSLHQQVGRYEVRLTLCPSLAAPVLVQPEAGDSKGQTHPWSSKCDCRQAVSARPNHTDGMGSPSGGFQPSGSNLAPSLSGHVCNEVQLQTSPICVSRAGPQCLGGRCSDGQLGEPGHVRFSPSVVTGQGSQQTVGPSVQEGHIDCSRLAQHAMVLGSGGPVISNPSLSTLASKPSDTTVQQGLSQGSDQPKPSCLVPRAEAIKEQGFSSPVAARIEAPQRSSTRTIYEAKWAVFVRWCQTSQVDFRSPSIKNIADFLLHLFQEKNLQPSTIEGYSSAIADKLGNSSLNVSKDENLARLLDSFHRDRPKGLKGIPS